MDAEVRFRGCLLGLAVGDAIGAAVEFKPRDTFPPLTDMVGGGFFALAPCYQNSYAPGLILMSCGFDGVCALRPSTLEMTRRFSSNATRACSVRVARAWSAAFI